jgi:Xaa-Pro aminopeptidase
MHELKYSSDGTEGVSAGFKEDCLLQAREKSWHALQEISKRLQPGINEFEAIHLASDILRELGCDKSWHRPVIRFGSNTIQPFSTPPDKERVLKEEDIFYVDIGPVWKEADGLEYEGDVGQTFSRGENSEFARCISTGKELHQRASEFWRFSRCSGDALYQWIEQETEKLGYGLVVEQAGHRIGDFPHKKFSRLSLKKVEFIPVPNLWILEVHLKDREGKYGAFFEDILR